MGFRNKSYIRIFSFEENPSGKSGTIRIAISKKNKQTERYETEFAHNFVMVAGTALAQMKAHEIPEKGLQARISSCDVTGNIWNKEEKKASATRFIIYGLDFEGDPGFDSKAKDTDGKFAKKGAAPSHKSVSKNKTDDDEDEVFDF